MPWRSSMPTKSEKCDTPYGVRDNNPISRSELVDVLEHLIKSSSTRVLGLSAHGKKKQERLFGVHVNAPVNDPKLQDRVASPDVVYPLLQAGVHVAP